MYVTCAILLKLQVARVWLLSKNLVNHVEIKVLTKHLVRSRGAVCAV